MIGEHVPSLSPGGGLHSECWRAITFGPHPRMVIVACPKRVRVLDLRQRIDPTEGTATHTDIKIATLNSPLPAHPRCFQSRTLYESQPGVRIYALSSPDTPHNFQCCIVTTSHILLLDTRYPNRPIITWTHHMDDNPPISVEFQQGAKNKSKLLTL